jgi:hypothetical protein
MIKKYQQTPEGKAVLKKSIRSWIEKNPKKYISHMIVNTAIKYGVIKIEPCKICGESKKVHAHHPDYDRPFDVIWLCPTHHTEEHLSNKLSYGE